MGSKKNNKKQTIQKIASNSSASARNLPKNDLGAIIFGCKNHTIKECFSKELFGLPAQHFAYVRKVSPGLLLFLFNYTDRTLHGIFEAASHGQLNIDPHAWTGGSVEYTQYPAQVQFNVLKRCHALTEDQFSPIISDNYYQTGLFWFELDRIQTTKLMELFSPSPLVPYHVQLHPHSIPTWEVRSSVPQRNAYKVCGEELGETTNTSLPCTIAKRWSSLFKGGSTSDVVSKQSNEGWKVRGEMRVEGQNAQTLGHSASGAKFSDIVSKLVQTVELLMERQKRQEEKIQALEMELVLRACHERISH